MATPCGLLGLLVLAAAGCKDDKAVASSDESARAIADAEEAGEDLVARRDQLLATRRQLALQRAELDKRRASIEAEGGDPSILEEESSDLRAKEREVSEQLVSVSSDLIDEFKKQKTILSRMTAGTKDGAIAVRESSIATREETLAAREKSVATREAELAKRENQMALRWKESCGLGATTIIQSGEPRGTKYRRRDVQKALTRAQTAMRKRGIVTEDLPPSLRNLNAAASRGMSVGNYAEAFFAADQLERGVKSLAIDRAFVRSKFERVSGAVKGAVSDDVARLLARITSDFGEGRYTAANRKLNALIAQLR